MTIEQKALELVNAFREPGGLTTICAAGTAYGSYGACWKALCRALEAHEADKSRHAAEMREQAERFEAFRQEVSDAAEEVLKWGDRSIQRAKLTPFLLTKADPLVEVMEKLGWYNAPTDADDLRKALDARGLAIVKKEAVNG